MHGLILLNSVGNIPDFHIYSLTFIEHYYRVELI